MDGELIENGTIRSAEIRFSRGFILDCNIEIGFRVGVQVFGGYVLGGNPFDAISKCAEHHRQGNYAADFIGGVMSVAGVNQFSELKGKVIRVKRHDEGGAIVAIGHAVEDRWYNPQKRFRLISGDAA